MIADAPVASTSDEVERTKELREQAKKNDVPFNELTEEQIIYHKDYTSGT